MRSNPLGGHWAAHAIAAVTLLASAAAWAKISNLLPYELSAQLPAQEPVWAEYGKPFDEFQGVKAYSNKSLGAGGKYQCTELIHRFLDANYKTGTKIGMGLGHAKDLALNLHRRFEGRRFRTPDGSKTVVWYYFKNGFAEVAPVVGSIISFDVPAHGHIAVVRAATFLAPERKELFLFEQHGEILFKVGEKKKIRSLTMARNAQGKWYGKGVIGWLTPMIAVDSPSD